jgi:hypothetical protein
MLQALQPSDSQEELIDSDNQLILFDFDRTAVVICYRRITDGRCPSLAYKTRFTSGKNGAGYTLKG